METARIPTQFLSEAEYAPGEPLQVRRHALFLADFPLQKARPETPFFPPGTLVVTDRPDLLDRLDDLPDDLLVFSTEPLSAPGRGRFHVSDRTPEAVERLIAEVGAVGHIRVLTELGASTKPDIDALWAERPSLVALHDLTFLVLQRCFDAVRTGGSCIALFVNAVPAGLMHPLAGLFTGMIKSAAMEMPDSLTYAVLWSGSDVAAAIRQTEEESGAERYLPVVAYHDGARKTVRVKAEPGRLSADTPARIDSDSVIVATAGARGITAELLKAVAQHFRPHLFLLGSNPLDSYPPEIFEGSDEEFGKRRPEYLREQRAAHPELTLGQINKRFERILEARAARQNIEAMAAACGADKVHYIACNVMDRANLSRAIDGVVQSAGKIDLLVNGAGLNRSASIPRKSFADFQAVRDIKLRGYQNLRYATRNCRPRMWCNFGSLVGFAGLIGETDYASGNDLLYTTADYATRALGAEEFTIGWTLWDEVGMGADPIKRAGLRRAGTLTSMSTAEGIHHFIREINLTHQDPCTVHVGAAEENNIARNYPALYKTLQQEAEDASSPLFYLDRVLSRDTNEILFERVFDLEKDWYLRHHLVNGHPTLPGTFVAEIAAEAAGQLVPGLHIVACERVVFHHFLRVYDDNKPVTKKIHARILDQSPEQTVVQVRVLTDIVAPNGTVLVKDRLHFEARILMSDVVPEAPYWQTWDPIEETPIPDPYHFPAAPVLLTGVFVSTTNTRVTARGKRATYQLNLPPGDPAFSTFRMPSILLDGLARVAALTVVEGDYIPLAAPRSVRRIDLYERANDYELAQRHNPIELYVTPPDLTFEDAEMPSRFVAVRPDGRIILQMKDITAVILGYVDRRSGDFVGPEQMEELKQRRSYLDLPGRV